MDTVTESKMATIAKAGGIKWYAKPRRKKQILEIKKVKSQKLLVGAAVDVITSLLEQKNS